MEEVDGGGLHRRQGKLKSKDIRDQRKADKRYEKEREEEEEESESEYEELATDDCCGGGGGPRRLRKKSKKAKRDENLSWYQRMDFRSVVMLLLMAGGALQYVVPAVAQFADLFVSHYEELDASDPDVLLRVFSSGQAWAVLCHNGTGPVSAVFQEAASQSRTMTPRYAQPRWATFDCGVPLPSGKTTLERFDLMHGRGHVVAFTVANGKRPEQIPSAMFVRAGRPGYQSTPIANQGAQVLRHVNSRTKLPKLRSAGSTAQLRKHCLDKRSCGLLLYPGAMPDATARLQLQQLMAGHRLTRFVTMDAKKYMLDPLEPKLPPVHGGVKAYPRFVYFRRQVELPAPVGEGGEGAGEGEGEGEGAGEGEGEGEGEDAGQGKKKKGKKKKGKKKKLEKKPEKKVSWKAKAYRSHFSAPEVSVFLGEIEDAERAEAGGGETGVRMARIRKAPKISTRPKKDAAKKKTKKKKKKKESKGKEKGASTSERDRERRKRREARAAKRASSSKKPNIRVKDDVAGASAAAEQRRAQAEKERLRREEMERQAHEKYPHLADDDWDWGDDAEEDDEEEEEEEEEGNGAEEGDDEDEINLDDWDDDEE